MTFKMEDAAKVAKHYQFLIGRGFYNKPGQYAINYVVVAPSYGETFQRFLTHFAYNENNEIALGLSGFNRNEMMVFAIYYDSFSNIMLYEDIDSFLSKNGLEKVYEKEDFFKAE